MFVVMGCDTRHSLCYALSRAQLVKIEGLLCGCNESSIYEVLGLQEVY